MDSQLGNSNQANLLASQKSKDIFEIGSFSKVQSGHSFLRSLETQLGHVLKLWKLLESFPVC